MKAEFNKEDYLVIKPETHAERMALEKWCDENKVPEKMFVLRTLDGEEEK